MALKIDTKFEGKLTCAFKNSTRDLANFHWLKSSDFILESKMAELNHWHPSHSNRKWLKQPQVIFTEQSLTEVTVFPCFDVFSVRSLQIFQVHAKISTMQPMFQDYLSASYGYDLSYSSTKYISGHGDIIFSPAWGTSRDNTNCIKELLRLSSHESFYSIQCIALKRRHVCWN